jgi:HEAT repeat protein
MKPRLSLGLLVFLLPLLLGAETSVKTPEEQRRDIIRYGTENEIAALVRTLREEEAYYLDDELRDLARETRNRSILTEAFSFFGGRAKGGLEEPALRVVDAWDEEASETVLAAVDYLGRVKAAEALLPLEDLLNMEERRFMGACFRALGRIAGGGDADAVAEYLMGYYTNRNPADEFRRDIIAALGETGSKQGVSFLADIAGNDDAGLTLRQTALDGLSKIGDDRGLDAVLAAAASTDPNVRSSAVAALGPFSGPAVDRVILESFRDSYYRTRIGAAKAAGERKLTEAVPYLSFRAEQDETPAVKDEAIRALGAIASGDAMAALDNLFENRKNADRVRILAAENLIQNNPGSYAEKVIGELDEAKKKNQTALYNGFLRVIGGAKTDAVRDLTGRFFASGGVLEKSYALDMTAANSFLVFVDQVRALTDERNGSLARKARTTLEKLGQPSSPPEEAPPDTPPPPDPPPPEAGSAAESTAESAGEGAAEAENSAEGAEGENSTGESGTGNSPGSAEAENSTEAEDAGSESRDLPAEEI